MPSASGRPCRLRLDEGGPVLVEGPVEVVLPDGSVRSSDRFQVALCVCRRSRDYPWCDTSHRRRVRTGERGRERGRGTESGETEESR
ncbi:CDGSH iron-sulfur domain-containing protein [Streptomyces sp. NPDC059853]|uniref:CDGSH iron-sulfur domain-containing protein n=1 Tax=Streptomyces sp. NPDC059853 TaxID=3346973 RepID=UPI00364B6314